MRALPRAHLADGLGWPGHACVVPWVTLHQLFLVPPAFYYKHILYNGLPRGIGVIFPLYHVLPLLPEYHARRKCACKGGAERGVHSKNTSRMHARITPCRTPGLRNSIEGGCTGGDGAGGSVALHLCIDE